MTTDMATGMTRPAQAPTPATAPTRIPTPAQPPPPPLHISYIWQWDIRFSYEQAGLRHEFSTMDHIFTLHSSTEYHKCKKGRVSCAFIDYCKAFDLTDRVSLWVKLLNHGANGKILGVIQNIYHKAKSVVEIDITYQTSSPVTLGCDKEKIYPRVYLQYILTISSPQWVNSTMV